METGKFYIIASSQKFKSKVFCQVSEKHDVTFFDPKARKPLFTVQIGGKTGIKDAASILSLAWKTAQKVQVDVGGERKNLFISTKEEKKGTHSIIAQMDGAAVHAIEIEPQALEPVTAGVLVVAIIAAAFVIDRELARPGSSGIAVTIKPGEIIATIDSAGGGPPLLPDNGGDGEDDDEDDSGGGQVPSPNPGNNNPPPR